MTIISIKIIYDRIPEKIGTDERIDKSDDIHGKYGYDR